MSARSFCSPRRRGQKFFACAVARRRHQELFCSKRRGIGGDHYITAELAGNSPPLNPCQPTFGCGAGCGRSGLVVGLVACCYIVLASDQAICAFFSEVQARHHPAVIFQPYVLTAMGCTRLPPPHLPAVAELRRGGTSAGWLVESAAPTSFPALLIPTRCGGSSRESIWPTRLETLIEDVLGQPCRGSADRVNRAPPRGNPQQRRKRKTRWPVPHKPLKPSRSPRSVCPKLDTHNKAVM